MSACVGNIDVARDWGSAPEYVEAMHAMLQFDKPTDFVIATGETHALRELLAAAFEELGLNWAQHVDLDVTPTRPSDIAYSGGDASKARRLLGWRATRRMRDVIKAMVEEEMRWQEASLAAKNA